MECIVQYLDDLEDLVYAFALKWERIRSKLRFALFIAAAVSLQIFGIFLALSEPPLAMALAAALVLCLLNHGVVLQGTGPATA
jgi:hypothetical protein